jgi:hypothetical protein
MLQNTNATPKRVKQHKATGQQPDQKRCRASIPELSMASGPSPSHKSQIRASSTQATSQEKTETDPAIQTRSLDADSTLWHGFIRSLPDVKDEASPRWFRDRASRSISNNRCLAPVRAYEKPEEARAARNIRFMTSCRVIPTTSHANVAAAQAVRRRAHVTKRAHG